MTDETRTILELTEYWQIGPTDIAKATGMKQSSVSRRLSRDNTSAWQPATYQRYLMAILHILQQRQELTTANTHCPHCGRQIAVRLMK